MRSIPLRSLALSCLIFVAGCPKAGLRFGPGGPIESPEALLAALDQRDAKILSIRAEPNAALRAPEQSITLRQLIAAEAPASLHLEVLDFFNRPAALLVTDGERFAIHELGSGDYYVGPATPQNLALLLQFPIAPREIVGALLGRIPRIAAQRVSLEIDVAKRAYRLVLEAGSVVQTLWVATDDLRPIASQIRGVAAYDLEFDDYVDRKPLPFPERISIKAVDSQGRGTGTSITLRHGEALELNPPISPTVFVLERPVGSKLHELR